MKTFVPSYLFLIATIFVGGCDEAPNLATPETARQAQAPVVTAERSFAWISNAAEGTMSLIDTRAEREIARYAAARPDDPSLPAYGCSEPSRTAVDAVGNVYIGLRSSIPDCVNEPNGTQGGITKIALYRPDLCQVANLDACPCVDRNQNGVIDTSRDCGGLGTGFNGACVGEGEPDGIDINDPNEFLGADDECIVWSRPVGDDVSAVRALSLDADGFLWVGEFRLGNIFKFDSDGTMLDPDGDGAATTEAGIFAAINPYGSLADASNRIWFLNNLHTGQLRFVDADTGELSGLFDDPDVGGYGMTMDSRGRIWMSSLNNPTAIHTDPVVSRFDPNTEQWAKFSTPLAGDEWLSRGVAADAFGRIWVTANEQLFGDGPSFLLAFDEVDGSLVDQVDLTNGEGCLGLRTIGVAVDVDGKVWVGNKETDSVCVYNPATQTLSSVAVGSKPYTYSNFTGFIAAASVVVVDEDPGLRLQGAGGCRTTPMGPTFAFLILLPLLARLRRRR